MRKAVLGIALPFAASSAQASGGLDLALFFFSFPAALAFAVACAVFARAGTKLFWFLGVLIGLPAFVFLLGGHGNMAWPFMAAMLLGVAAVVGLVMTASGRRKVAGSREQP